MSLYLWWMDRKFHRMYVKQEKREMLAHLPPHKLTYHRISPVWGPKRGDHNLPSKYLEERKVYYTQRCVCHLMEVHLGDELIAWPYRTSKGKVGVSWYHPEGVGLVEDQK